MDSDRHSGFFILGALTLIATAGLTYYLIRRHSGDHDPLGEANAKVSRCLEMISELESSLTGAKAAGNP